MPCLVCGQYTLQRYGSAQMVAVKKVRQAVLLFSTVRSNPPPRILQRPTEFNEMSHFNKVQEKKVNSAMHRDWRISTAVILPAPL